MRTYDTNRRGDSVAAFEVRERSSLRSAGWGFRIAMDGREVAGVEPHGSELRARLFEDAKRPQSAQSPRISDRTPLKIEPISGLRRLIELPSEIT